MTVREVDPEQAKAMKLGEAAPHRHVRGAGTSADRGGLKVGDVLVEVDGVVEPTVAQLQEQAKDGQILVRAPPRRLVLRGIRK